MNRPAFSSIAEFIDFKYYLFYKTNPAEHQQIPIPFLLFSKKFPNERW